MKYDAFISYRHTPLDMETAKKVHSGLETFHIPKPVQEKTGKKKISRVFRDQEELPIGSDLNDNISSALENSEYLIVICSPDTPGSYWVSKEIDTFISLHGRDKILAVLVSGEPSDSFPKQLLTDDLGNPVEPLAADMRGATPKERKQRYKTEILRLAAPIIGCSYDDLKQRHRERIIKRNIAIASICAGVIAIAGTAFGIYNAGVADRMQKLADEKSQLADEKSQLAEEKTQLADEMSQLADQMSKLAAEKSQLADDKTRLAEEKSQLADQILEEYREKQKNQSKFYAEKALSVLNTGKREDAALIALAGLPVDDDRPYVPAAEYALSTILHAYDDGSELAYDRTLSHDLPVQNLFQSADGKYLVTVDMAYTVYVWDLDTWDLLCEIPSTIDVNTNTLANVKSVYTDSETLYITTNKYFSAYDLLGNIKYTVEFPATYGSIISQKAGKAFLIDVDKISVINTADGSKEAEIINESEDYYSERAIINNDNTKIAVAHYAFGKETATGRVSVIDTADYSVSYFDTSLPYVSRLMFTQEGYVVAVSSVDPFEINNPAFSIDMASDTGELIWAREVPVSRLDFAYSILLKSNIVDGEEIAVLTVYTDTFTFDVNTGETISHTSLSSSARTLDLIDGYSTAYVGYDNGDIEKIDIINGVIYPYATITTNLPIHKMEVINNGAAICSLTSADVWILQYHFASDLTAVPDPVQPSRAVGSSPAGYYVMCENSNYHSFHFYDGDNKLLYSFEDETSLLNAYCFSEDSFILCGYYDLWVINPIEKNVRKINFKENGMDEYQSITGVTFSPNKKFAAVYNMFYVAVVDIENGTLTYKQKNTNRVGTCAVSSDGNTLLTSRSGETIEILDIPTGTIKMTQDENLTGLFQCILDISPDGKYAAFTCADGNIRIINLPNGDVYSTIHLPTKNRAFLSFSADSSHLFIQGDTLELQVWKISPDVTDGSGVEYIGSIEDMQLISFVTEDPDGFIAFCDDISITLIETGEYGTVAFVKNATLYLPGDNSFIISKGEKLYKTYYKDYKQLIEEVHAQFPNAVLTDEMKTRYNIE